MKITPSLTTVNKIRDRFIKKYYRRLNATILKDLQPLIKQIEIGNINPKFEIDINVFDDVNDLYTTVGTFFGKITKSEFSKVVKKSKDDIFFSQFMQDYFDSEVAQLIVNVDDEIKRQIRNVIEKSIVDGMTIVDSQKFILSQIKKISKKRALVIARTETIKANNMGSLAGAESSGVDYNKEWITHVDSRTRSSHIGADGQIVHKSKPFIVDGEKLEAPCDTSHGASAGNVIQCRCTIGYIPILPKIFEE